MAPRKSTAKPALEHREGCSSERVETYPTRRPNGEPVTVERCLDCGAALVSATTTLAPAPAEESKTEEDSA